MLVPAGIPVGFPGGLMLEARAELGSRSTGQPGACPRGQQFRGRMIAHRTWPDRDVRDGQKSRGLDGTAYLSPPLELRGRGHHRARPARRLQGGRRLARVREGQERQRPEPQERQRLEPARKRVLREHPVRPRAAPLR